MKSLLFCLVFISTGFASAQDHMVIDSDHYFFQDIKIENEIQKKTDLLIRQFYTEIQMALGGSSNEPLQFRGASQYLHAFKQALPYVENEEQYKFLDSVAKAYVLSIVKEGRWKAAVQGAISGKMDFILNVTKLLASDNPFVVQATNYALMWFRIDNPEELYALIVRSSFRAATRTKWSSLFDAFNELIPSIKTLKNESQKQHFKFTFEHYIRYPYDVVKYTSGYSIEQANSRVIGKCLNYLY